MRDSTVPRANITRPDMSGSFTVLLERTPYGGEYWLENAVGSPENRAWLGVEGTHGERNGKTIRDRGLESSAVWLTERGDPEREVKAALVRTRC